MTVQPPAQLTKLYHQACLAHHAYRQARLHQPNALHWGLRQAYQQASKALAQAVQQARGKS